MSGGRGFHCDVGAHRVRSDYVTDESDSDMGCVDGTRGSAVESGRDRNADLGSETDDRA